MIEKNGKEWILYTNDGTKILGKFRKREQAEMKLNEIYKIYETTRH